MSYATRNSTISAAKFCSWPAVPPAPLLLLVIFLWTLALLPAAAGELEADPDTLLLLHCNDTIEGAGGETPTLATGVIFEPGVFESGAYFASGNQVFYPSSENIESTQGTLEFWLKPSWNGNDGQDHFVLKFGDAGGMLFGKDAANNLRVIVNRYGVGGYPEAGVGINIGDWQAEGLFSKICGCLLAQVERQVHETRRFPSRGRYEIHRLF